MNELEAIEELNNKGYFKIKKVGKNEVEIITHDGHKFNLCYQLPVSLNIINRMIDKQIFKPYTKVKVPPNAEILCNLRFDFFHVSTPKDWVYLCDVAMRYVYSKEEPYQALIRLILIGENRYEITNIDRNRDLWKKVENYVTS